MNIAPPINKPLGTLTAAERRMSSDAEIVIAKALSGLKPDLVPAILAAVLLTLYPDDAEWIGERTGTLAHQSRRA